MLRPRLLIAWLAMAAMVAMVTGGAAALASEDAAEVVPRADDVSLKLSIENIDGKVVNVPEASIRKIPPGDHYLGIKIEFRDLSAGSLFSGLGAFSAITGALSEKPASHDGVSFTALPGRRYLVNGAMVDGKPKVWIDEELFETGQDDDGK